MGKAYFSSSANGNESGMWVCCTGGVECWVIQMGTSLATDHVRTQEAGQVCFFAIHCSCTWVSGGKFWCSKMQPLSGNQRPDLLTALMNMSLLLRLPRKMHLCRSSSNVPRLPSFLEMHWKCYKTRTFCSLLTRYTIPCACHAKRHLNVQKWSEHVVFFTFWLRNVLRTTMACTFSTSQLPKLVRTWCVLYILTLKCASRHNGVQFFISHLPSGLRTRRFSEPTFRPSGATNHCGKKRSVSRLSYLFAHLDLLSSETSSFLIFFLLLFFSLTLPISAFHLSILSEVWLLNFLRLYLNRTCETSKHHPKKTRVCDFLAWKGWGLR